MDKILQPLDELIRSRKEAKGEQSYTTSLFEAGRAKIAQKLGEESVELVIAATCDDKEGIINESADLLYHWLVLLADSGIALEEVEEALSKRQGTSGHAEKAARKS